MTRLQTLLVAILLPAIMFAAWLIQAGPRKVELALPNNFESNAPIRVILTKQESFKVYCQVSRYGEELACLPVDLTHELNQLVGAYKLLGADDRKRSFLVKIDGWVTVNGDITSQDELADCIFQQACLATIDSNSGAVQLAKHESESLHWGFSAEDVDSADLQALCDTVQQVVFNADVNRERVEVLSSLPSLQVVIVGNRLIAPDALRQLILIEPLRTINVAYATRFISGIEVLLETSVLTTVMVNPNQATYLKERNDGVLPGNFRIVVPD